MRNESLLQTFALDNTSRVRSIEEVERGRACDCTCPSCGGRVIARQGDINVWHFAHDSGLDCPGAAETALHEAAKQLLMESGGMTLPARNAWAEKQLADGRRGVGEAHRPATWCDFTEAETEKRMDDIQPDFVARFGDQWLAVEVAVTHFVEQEKLTKLRARNLWSIEIDLALVDRRHWNWELLRELIIDGSSHKTWLVPIPDAELEAQAADAALQDALRKPVPVTQRSASRPPRRRYWIKGQMLDLIFLKYTVAVWAPYNPTMIELIKSLVYPLGGRYQPKARQWHLPIHAKEALQLQLHTLADAVSDIS